MARGSKEQKAEGKQKKVAPIQISSARPEWFENRSKNSAWVINKRRSVRGKKKKKIKLKAEWEKINKRDAEVKTGDGERRLEGMKKWRKTVTREKNYQKKRWRGETAKITWGMQLNFVFSINGENSVTQHMGKLLINTWTAIILAGFVYQSSWAFKVVAERKRCHFSGDHTFEEKKTKAASVLLHLFISFLFGQIDERKSLIMKCEMGSKIKSSEAILT